MNELGRAATHGASQQLVQGAFGNQMSWQGFAAGAAGSLVGSGIEAGGTSLGMSKGLIDATQIAGSATMGGLMADDFWQGFSTSAIVGAANHAMHHLQTDPPSDIKKQLIEMYGMDRWREAWNNFLSWAGDNYSKAVSWARSVLSAQDTQRGGMVSQNSGSGGNGVKTEATEKVEHCVDCAPTFGGKPKNLGERSVMGFSLLNRILGSNKWPSYDSAGYTIYGEGQFYSAPDGSIRWIHPTKGDTIPQPNLRRGKGHF